MARHPGETEMRITMRDLAAKLRDIASGLQTRIDEGAFALCFDYIRDDMSRLPAALLALAEDVEPPPSIAFKDRTHCPRGHPYSGDNLMAHNGRRSCRECNRVAAREGMRRRRAAAKLHPAEMETNR